jgi:hypothetical protein
LFINPLVTNFAITIPNSNGKNHPQNMKFQPDMMVLTLHTHDGGSLSNLWSPGAREGSLNMTQYPWKSCELWVWWGHGHWMNGWYSEVNQHAPAPTSAPSTGCPLLLSCGWTSTELIFGLTLVTNAVGNRSHTLVDR